jgi:hypothetical protein
MLKDAFSPNENKNSLPAEITADDFERIFKTMGTNQVCVVADHS